jgi:hypothetical protein
MAAHLVHGEPEIGDDLLEGNARTTLLEKLARGGNGAAVFLGQLVIVVNHGFEQTFDGRKLRGRQLVDQLVNALAGVAHGVISVASQKQYRKVPPPVLRSKPNTFYEATRWIVFYHLL